MYATSCNGIVVSANELELHGVADGRGDGVGDELETTLADLDLVVGGGGGSREGEDAAHEHVCGVL